MDRTSALVRGAIGLPLDFGGQVLSTLNEALADPVSRLSPGYAVDLPLWSLNEHLEAMRRQAHDNATSDYDVVNFEVTSSRNATPFELVTLAFQSFNSFASWGLGSPSFDTCVSAIDVLAEVWQMEEGGCSRGKSTGDRHGRWQYAIDMIGLERRDEIARWLKKDLLGIAPVQWFGSAFVEAFGGDGVFEALPDGWAEKVRPGLWKVFGAEDPEDPEAFQVASWSDRERALIEALGPKFFFNVETGELATEFVEIPIATQYPVYVWDKAAGELVIHEPDGSTRPANLEELAPDPVAVRAGPPDVAHLVVDRMNGVLGDESFEVDDQLYWVEMHLENLSELEETWVERFSVWLGEHVIKGILDAEWVELDGRWVVSSSRGVFDPEPVVRATVGSAAPVARRVMVSAACAAMGIPLP